MSAVTTLWFRRTAKKKNVWRVVENYEKLLAVSLRWWRFGPKIVVAPRLRLRSSAARTHCDVVNCVHCLISMYCFRGLPRLRFPSTYPSSTVLVIWQPWSLKRCPPFESLRLRTCQSNTRFMPSSCIILLSVTFIHPAYTLHSTPKTHFHWRYLPFTSQLQSPNLLLRKTNQSIAMFFPIVSATGMDRSFHMVRTFFVFAIAMRAFTTLEQSPSDDLREPIYLKCFTFFQLGRCWLAR